MLKDYEIPCDFCGKKRKFEKCSQITLKIEKANSHQNLFAMRCNVCEEKGMRRTLSGQSLKTITSRNSQTEETSVLNSNEENKEIF